MTKDQIEKKLWWWNKDYKKDRSIAFFNSTNAAIERCKQNTGDGEDCIKRWRKFFLKEHKEWYLKTFPKPELHAKSDIEAKLPLDNKTKDIIDEQERVEQENWQLLEK